MKLKFTWRIWIWIIVLTLALIAIFGIPPHIFQKGVIIKSVEQNSSAFEAGLRANQIITAIDGKTVANIDDYSKIIQEKFSVNSSTNVKTTIKTTTDEYDIYSNIAPEITVSNLEKTNIKTGLDLSGGSRALVQAKNHSLTKIEIDNLVSIVSNRFNAYGISDVTVKSVRDLSGNYFMSVEIAGATPKDLESLISQQGKFEGKIGNETIFIGGNQDIRNIAEGGQNSFIGNCNSFSGGYICQFKFTVTISPESAERQAKITQNLTVITASDGERFLSKQLDLYLDDKPYGNLSIGEGLKGNPTTQIEISGTGSGETQADAVKNTEEEMRKLKTILRTGSLPFQLEIVKIDTISPTLGGTFTKNILIAGALALFSVAVIIFIKYRKLKLAIPPLLICASEIIITLGIATVIKQDLDLPGIAGILAAIFMKTDKTIKKKEGIILIIFYIIFVLIEFLINR